jgi:peroxiredoxin (alkyl hydroperoxide reductase subunit C)
MGACIAVRCIDPKKGDQMASSLVTKKAPAFSMDAYDPSTDSYVTVSSEDYAGEWTAICFYPGDFTFV